MKTTQKTKEKQDKDSSSKKRKAEFSPQTQPKNKTKDKKDTNKENEPSSAFSGIKVPKSKVQGTEEIIELEDPLKNTSKEKVVSFEEIDSPPNNQKIQKSIIAKPIATTSPSENFQTINTSKDYYDITEDNLEDEIEENEEVVESASKVLPSTDFKDSISNAQEILNEFIKIENPLPFDHGLKYNIFLSKNEKTKISKLQEMYSVDIKKKFLNYLSKDTKKVMEKHFPVVTFFPPKLLTDTSLLTIVLQIKFWESESVRSYEIDQFLKVVYPKWTVLRFSRKEMLNFINYYLDLSETKISFKSSLIVQTPQSVSIKEEERLKFQALLKEEGFHSTFKKLIGDEFKNVNNFKAKTLQSCWSFFRTKITTLPTLMIKKKILYSIEQLKSKSPIVDTKVKDVTYLDVDFKFNYRSVNFSKTPYEIEKKNIKKRIEETTPDITLSEIRRQFGEKKGKKNPMKDGFKPEFKDMTLKEQNEQIEIEQSAITNLEDQEDLAIRYFIQYIMTSLSNEKTSDEETHDKAMDICLNTFEKGENLNVLISHLKMEVHRGFAYKAINKKVGAISAFCLKNGKKTWNREVSGDNPLRKYLDQLENQCKKEEVKVEYLEDNLLRSGGILTVDDVTKSLFLSTYTNGFREISHQTLKGKDLDLYFRFRTVNGVRLVLTFSMIKSYINKTNNGQLSHITMVEDPDIYRSGSNQLYVQLRDRGFFEKTILELVKSGVYYGKLTVKEKMKDTFIWPVSKEAFCWFLDTISERLHLKHRITMHSGKNSHITSVIGDGKNLVEKQAQLLVSTGSRSHDVNCLQGYFKQISMGLINDQEMLFEDINLVNGEPFRYFMAKKHDDSSDMNILKIISLLDKKPIVKDEEEEETNTTRNRKKKKASELSFPFLPKSFQRHLSSKNQSLSMYYNENLKGIQKIDPNRKKVTAFPVKGYLSEKHREEKNKINEEIGGICFIYFSLEHVQTTYQEFREILTFVKDKNDVDFTFDLKKNVLEDLTKFVGGLEFSYKHKKKGSEIYTGEKIEIEKFEEEESKKTLEEKKKLEEEKKNFEEEKKKIEEEKKRLEEEKKKLAEELQKKFFEDEKKKLQDEAEKMIQEEKKKMEDEKKKIQEEEKKNLEVEKKNLEEAKKKLKEKKNKIKISETLTKKDDTLQKQLWKKKLIEKKTYENFSVEDMVEILQDESFEKQITEVFQIEELDGSNIIAFDASWIEKVFPKQPLKIRTKLVKLFKEILLYKTE